MKIASEIKKLSAFLKEQDFLAIPQNVRSLRSWVKELDSKNLIYMYVYINHHREGRQSGYLIISPPLQRRWLGAEPFSIRYSFGRKLATRNWLL